MVVRSKNESRMQMSIMVMKARMQMRIWMSAIKDGDEGEDVYDDMDEGDRGSKLR